MKTAGIIAEYNPFHNGHAYHIQKTRELLGGDCAVVCVMSGNFVQRGEPAAFSKSVRAQAAVSSGADLVFELPCFYSLSGAERFAESAVALLNAFGAAEWLSFGCECGDLELLSEAARLVSSSDMRDALAHELRRGVGFAEARQKALEKISGRDCSFIAEPNNILAIEYLKALEKTGSAMLPLPVKRLGAGHDSPSPEYGGASASFIRAALARGEDIPREHIPETAAALFKREISAGRFVTLSDCESSVMTRLRTASDAEFAALPDMSEGLDRRIMSAARSCATLGEVYETVKTKRYALSRIRRAVMCLWLGITEADAALPPQYLRLLAANEKGRALLHSAKPSVPIITKPASAKKLPGEAARLFALEARSTDLYSLCFKNAADRGGGSEWTTSPIML
jgi:predicted nucleotidyltransferase